MEAIDSRVEHWVGAEVAVSSWTEAREWIFLLVITSASLVVTSALLVVTKKLLETSATLLVTSALLVSKKLLVNLVLC